MCEFSLDLEDFNPDVHFGLATFSDYPFGSFGTPGIDLPYIRDVDLAKLNNADGTLDAFLDTVNNLVILSGNDGPESQLVALYQIVTGAGQVVDLAPYDLSGTFVIDAGQGMSFREDALKIM